MELTQPSATRVVYSLLEPVEYQPSSNSDVHDTEQRPCHKSFDEKDTVVFLMIIKHLYQETFLTLALSFRLFGGPTR